MRVKRSSWHAAVYLWWYAHKYTDAEGEKTSANLCPYVRTVLIYAPLRFLLTDWKTKWLPITIWPTLLIGIPKLVGWFSYNLKVEMWIVEMCLGGFAGLMLALKNYSEHHKNVFQRIDNAWQNTKTERDIVKAYIRSGHDRICPEITLES